METSIFYLKPDAPFHLQTGGGDHETVDLYPRSDTMSAAISYLWFRQYGDIPGFPEQMPFQVSSVFPAIKVDNSYERLYPKPMGLKIDRNKHDHKVFKKIQWLDSELFELWRSGGTLDDYWPENSSDTRLKRNGTVLVKNPEKYVGKGNLLKTDSRTRVVLDRVNSASTPFHFVRVFYEDDLHLWFYTDLNPSLKKQFKAMLRMLGDEGIGADRTVGMGQFSIIANERINKVPSGKKGRWLNMGIFNPLPGTTTQIEWEQSAYNLETRTGWVSGHTLRRRPVPCIVENSVLKSDQTPQGNVPCVVDKDDDKIPLENRPNYSVYRDCRGYFIPI